MQAENKPYALKMNRLSSYKRTLQFQYSFLVDFGSGSINTNIGIKKQYFISFNISNDTTFMVWIWHPVLVSFRILNTYFIVGSMEVSIVFPAP